MASRKTWRPVAPPRLAICELVEVDAAPLPVEVREAIRRLAEYGIPLGCTDADWNRWRNIVTVYLDAQGKEGSDGE